MRLFNHQVLPVTPEKNKAYLTAELAGFLSKKANTKDTLEYRVIRSWMNGMLTLGRLNSLYALNSSYRSSQVNKILLKIVLLPQIVLMSFVKRCLPSSDQSEFLNRFDWFKKEVLQYAMQQPQFTQYIKMPEAEKVYILQWKTVKDLNLLSEFSPEVIDDAYESSWTEITRYGEPDYEINTSSPTVLLNPSRVKRISSYSPGMFDQLRSTSHFFRSISPASISSTPTTIMSNTPSSSPIL